MTICTIFVHCNSKQYKKFYFPIINKATESNCTDEPRIGIAVTAGYNC